MGPMRLELLRDCPLAELTGIFQEETAYWRDQLFWDYGATLRVIRGFLASGSLPGFVLRDERGQAIGYAYYVVDRPVAFIGNIYVSNRHADPAAYDLLIDRTSLSLVCDPEIQRIECQLFTFNANLRPHFEQRGFQTMSRHFLIRPLHGVAEPHLAENGTSPFRVVTWQQRYLAAAADVIYDSYICSYDAGLCRDYQSREGCCRFLHNLVENPACGVFSPAETLLAVDRGGKLCGLLLATRTDPATGMIPQLSIRREYQGRGLGTHLLALYLKRCREAGLQRVSLSVSDANGRAFRLYLRMGFQRHKCFDAYVWSRQP
jgi:ribosomal protein S18 acetylase RimI-like enzyme